MVELTTPTEQVATVNPGRRSMLRSAGLVGLSGAALAILGGCESMAAQKKADASMHQGDVDILNIALGLEHQAIAAYQIGAESGLLQKPVLATAVTFQSHHKAHRDALAATIEKLGGVPVAAAMMGDYAEQLNAGSITSQSDILELALSLEKGAADAYLGVIPQFKNSDLAQVAGRIAADEAMHWTTLASATGVMMPKNALYFGA